MRNSLIITLLLTASSLLTGQTPVGSWTDHLNYNLAKTVAVGSGEVFASTGSSMMVYNKHFNQLRKLSRVNGLSETGISTIGWSDSYETLVVAYLTSNVDLIQGNVIYNIPDISRKYIPGKKTINKIEINGKYAYLACSFGIVLIDLEKKEIHDTWKPGNEISTAEVFDLAFGNGKIFAATSIGVFSADLNNPGLAYYGNWSLSASLPSPAANYSHAIYVNGTLYVNRTGPFLPGDTIYAVDEGCSVFSYNPGVRFRSMEESENGFVISTGIAVHYYNNEGSQTDFFDTYSSGSLNINHVIYKDGLTWIADLSRGLVIRDSEEFTFLTLPGPLSADVVNVTSLNGKTVVCGGSVDVSWNNIWRPLQVSVNENNNWTTISSPSLFDPIRAFIDPVNAGHFFISTWGSGLLEYQNNELINQFTYTNSPLQTIIPNQPFVRICGMAMDGSGNLWLTQTEVPGSIKTLRSDGTWIVNPLTLNVPAVGDIIIARDGKKWIVLPRGNGVFILDDKGSPENFSDDDSREILITDNENRIISNVYCITEDLDGNIWIGTDQGPVIYYNPGRILEDDIRAYRIKIPRNDGSGLADYMLGTETITSIAVDGANRKWLGTASSGAYLLSPDGTKQIVNHNESNSPLFSNTINSIAVDEKNGNVWFATSRGLISVRGDAIEGKTSFSGVYSFPNPVREDYEGNVTITGLMRDTQIRITDISGNLVYKTVSDGGQASWDLTTYNGKRVSTGVYVVFCTSPDGSKSDVTKILVIN
ncbi:MAG: T9SS type A sorting domain-containing protein [Bacteroidales bacterium]|nr:T9SS type A sorting domain-containing protein [Bacteroidales bacterium]